MFNTFAIHNTVLLVQCMHGVPSCELQTIDCQQVSPNKRRDYGNSEREMTDLTMSKLVENVDNNRQH